MNPAVSVRPGQPISGRPAGYSQLESYSSLKKFWSYLNGATVVGRRLTLLRGDTLDTCRRRISGYRIPNAGGLIDAARVLTALEDGLTPHPALLALMSGDPDGLRVTLNEGYDLSLDFVLAFTTSRDLIVRPELKYRASEFVPPTEPLPEGLPLTPRRFARDELRVLLDRACGLAL
ncbi:hypothetical protein [Deinococcus altitudinis]|uniref:hypothetical protein n=1 Tax=Deinococcus altitudinis TaxID=468914 RepID=UPI003892C992